jgi:hypothetical protein
VEARDTTGIELEHEAQEIRLHGLGKAARGRETIGLGRIPGRIARLRWRGGPAVPPGRCRPGWCAAIHIAWATMATSTKTMAATSRR